MDAEWIVGLFIYKLQTRLLEGEATKSNTNTNLTNQVQEATHMLHSLQQSLKEARLGDDQISRLVRAVYSAEDATDAFLTRTMQQKKLSGRSNICHPFICFAYLRSQFVFKIQIKKFITLIQTADLNYNIPRSILQNDSIGELARGLCRSSSYLDEDKEVVGLDEQVMELIAGLVHEHEINSREARLVTVLGEGGSGKTTLVRRAYERIEVKRHFKHRIWVNVSNYVSRARDILFDSLKQVDEMVAAAEEPILEQDVISRLERILRNGRYLVVFDDVGETEVWSRLRDAFPLADTFIGSVIVVITPSVEVEHCVLAHLTLLRGRLNDAESWELFLKQVCIAEESSSNNLDLITFKEQILKLCGGLPLAVMLISGLLSKKELSNVEWSRVIEHANYLSGNVFALIYEELPSQMKPCFLYMGLFPKAFEIPVRRLFQLWIVEGLVTTLGESGPEDVAKMYLEQLISRNMIEVTRWRSDGIPKTCRMQGFLYDVFSSKSAGIGLFYIHHKSHSTSGDQPPFAVRRLSSYSGFKSNPSSEHYIGHLRSYISFSTQKGIPAGDIGMFLNNIIRQRGLGLLSVLDLEGVYKPRLPKALGKLVNLKYMGLRSTALATLPESVCDLPCLETVDVKHTMIITLPSSILMAKNLRNLFMDWIHFGDMYTVDPSDSVFSAKLQTLWGISISQYSTILNSLFKITALRKLGLKFSSASQEPINNWISQLTNLQSLRLRSVKPNGARGSIKLGTMAEHHKLLDLYLLGVLPRPIDVKRMPPNLKILTLSMSQLRQDPMRVLGKLPQLNILKLFADSYLGEEMTCHHGGFPQLRVLKLWKLVDLKEWTVKEGAMPCLKELEIRACKRLERLDGLKQVTTLKEVILTNMPSQFAKQVKENMGTDVFIKENDWKSCPLLA